MNSENHIIEGQEDGKIKEEEKEKGQAATERVNWKALLHKDELIRDDSSEKEYVTLAGLMRLAHEKGIKRTKTNVIQAPIKEDENSTVIYTIEFNDGTIFSAAGHADDENTTDIYKKFTLVMAESRAKSRAIRDALGISLVAEEERNVELDNNSPISDTQISLIKITMGRRAMKLEDILKRATRKVEKLEELTKLEATSLIHYLNKQNER